MLKRIVNKIKTEQALKKYRSDAEKRAQDTTLCQWGIVGTGSMAERFSRALMRHEGSNVRSVSSRSAKKGSAFAERHGAVASYSDVSSFAESERGKTEIAYIATPVSAHFDGVKACLEFGLNVLCEKPLSGTVEEAVELYSLADKHGVKLMEAMWSYCLPTYKEALKWICDNRIGCIRSIDIALCKNEPRPTIGVMNDYGVYAIAFALRFAGPALSLVRVVREDYKNECGNDCAWEIDALSDDGVCVHMMISAISAIESKALIHGDSGTIEFSPQFNRTNHLKLSDLSGSVLEEKVFDYVSEGYEYQISDAIQFVIHNEQGDSFDRELSIASARLRSSLLGIESGR